MNKILARVFLLVISAVVVGYSGYSAGAANKSVDPLMSSHARFLNEFGERRRVNTFFPNEQSIFFGLQKNLVNVGKGNLTFARRDLVSIGRVPLVAARIYDSSREEPGDFGAGWHLSYNETIEELPNGHLLYVDDSATSIQLSPSSNNQFAVFPPHPTDIESVQTEQDSSNQSYIQINFVDGWEKNSESREVDIDWYQLLIETETRSA